MGLLLRRHDPCTPRRRKAPAAGDVKRALDTVQVRIGHAGHQAAWWLAKTASTTLGGHPKPAINRHLKTGH